MLFKDMASTSGRGDGCRYEAGAPHIGRHDGKAYAYCVSSFLAWIAQQSIIIQSHHNTNHKTRAIVAQLPMFPLQPRPCSLIAEAGINVS